MYYSDGWEAKIDNEIVSHYRVNYILRALPIESGKHIITFEFKPKVVEVGTKIRYASISLFSLIIFLMIYQIKFNRT